MVCGTKYQCGVTFSSCVRHWLSSDTKEERLAWTGRLNEALANLRAWHADALRPVKRPPQTAAASSTAVH